MINKKTLFLVGGVFIFIVSYLAFNNDIFAKNIYTQIKERNHAIYQQIQAHHSAKTTYHSNLGKVCIPRDEVGIKIYMYHYIRPSHRDKAGGITWENSVTPGNFEKQMRYLWRQQKTHKTQVALFSELENREQYNCFPNENITLLSFDDGRRDNYKYAFPILKKFGLKGTFGIIINRIGFNGKRIDPFMTYEEIQEISKNPLMEIQSHSFTHGDLKTMGYEKQKKEICESKNLLEKRLNISINTFIVPMGHNTKETASIAKSCGYTYTLLTRPGTINASKLQKNAYTLPRIRVHRNMTGQELFGETEKYSK